MKDALAKVIPAPAGKMLKPEIGDVLCGGEYLVPFEFSDIGKMDSIALCNFPRLNNPWRALTKMRVDCQCLLDSTKYDCPYTNKQYWWIVPVVLITNHFEQFLAGTWYQTMFQNMLDDWVDNAREMQNDHLYDVKRMIVSENGDEVFKHHRFLPMFIGSGYTDCTLASDGHGEIKEARVFLDNGDFLVVKYWEWYNK